MIRSKRVNAYSDNAVLNEYYGLSTDTKPTKNVATGSVFTEVDTGATFLYDEESEDWTEVESGSGGGGGDSDLSIAEVTIINNTPIYYNVFVPSVYDEYITSNPQVLENATTQIEVIISDSKPTLMFFADDVSIDSVTGDIELDGDDIIITGDGTITILQEP